jgi:hypothetical protein
MRVKCGCGSVERDVWKQWQQRRADELNANGGFRIAAIRPNSNSF